MGFQETTEASDMPQGALVAGSLTEGVGEPLASGSNIWEPGAESDGGQDGEDADFARALSSFQNH